MGRSRGQKYANVWQHNGQLPSQYYRGLNFLLDGSQDGAIDAFTRALEVNSETFDTHIALGNVLRRRGEVERAIRIHQNLLARPSLPAAQLHLAHLELSRDYISAGLLDRAERLLVDLVNESGHHKRVAQRHLLEIFEAQRDWLSAQAVARELLPKRSFLKSATQDPNEVGQPVHTLLAHYCCEQSELALAGRDLNEARGQLDLALKYDRNCVRASLMLAELELDAGNATRALKTLHSIREQDVDMVSEAIGLLRKVYSAMSKREALQSYLRECFQARPSTRLLLAVAEEIATTRSSQAAKDYLRDHLTERPSLRGLYLLMSLHNRHEASDDEALQMTLVQRLIDVRPAYRCAHCGFSGQQMHWYCPGCKHWGTVRDLGTIGEFNRG